MNAGYLNPFPLPRQQMQAGETETRNERLEEEVSERSRVIHQKRPDNLSGLFLVSSF
jgi:hypothetical protein